MCNVSAEGTKRACSTIKTRHVAMISCRSCCLLNCRWFRSVALPLLSGFVFIFSCCIGSRVFRAFPVSREKTRFSAQQADSRCGREKKKMIHSVHDRERTLAITASNYYKAC